MKIPELNIINPGRVACLSIQYTDQQTALYGLMVLSKKKSNVEVVERISKKETLDEALQLVPKNTPVLVNVSGRIVLNKQYKYSEDKDNQVEEYVPSSQLSDFYCFELHVQNNIALSLCRKTVIDEIMAKITGSGFDAVDLVIGPSILGNLWLYNLSDKSEIAYPGGTIAYNSDIDELTIKLSKELATSNIINNIELTDTEIISYVHGISWFVKYQNASYYGSSPEGIAADYQFKHILNQSKFLVLGLIFVVLMINYLVNESYRKKESELSTQLSMNSGLISTLDSLESELRAKQKYIEAIGSNKTYYSLMLDQIAETVPSKIVLNKLSVNPLTKKIKKKEPVAISKEIQVMGWSKNSLLLNNWVNELERLEWVKDIEVIDYHKNSDEVRGEFFIKINMKE